MAEFKFGDITEKIIGCSMKVHAELGNGFQEVIYQRALAIEMKDEGLKFEREFTMPVYYKSHCIGERRVDFFVEKRIMVEIKALVFGKCTPGSSKKLFGSVQSGDRFTNKFWSRQPAVQKAA